MGKEKIENIKLIAERVPPGDNWELVIDKENIIEGLVQTLTQYMRKTKFKGQDGGVDEYNELLVKANEKFLKALEQHIKVFGEEG